VPLLLILVVFPIFYFVSPYTWLESEPRYLTLVMPVFAILIAGIGCLRGLQTGAGASAVGDAATKAVVSGIILLVVVDGLFAVVYYMLNI